MKAYIKLLSATGLAVVASSCNSFLDINQNPNSLTTAAPNAILAQALTVSAQLYTGGSPSTQNSFNTYGSWVAGYWGKTGGVSGYGEEQTYNYSTSFYATLFNQTYDNLEDYQVIQSQAATYPNHAAIARIMKVYNFLLLVDEYGDIPYTQALQGTTATAPVYDKAADIYKDFPVQLDGAIADIATAAKNNGQAVGTEDVVFQGNMAKWKQFAYTLKLRILMRESQTNDAALNSSVAAQLTALQTTAAADGGFITTDVVAQPGYAQNLGQQNPFYTRYGYTAAGSSATERQYQIPTQYILDQYSKNNDPRLTQFYTIGSRNGNAEYVGSKPGEASAPSFVATNPVQPSGFVGSRTSTPTVTGGFFKGLNAPTILMMNSEYYFLRAEAETRGLFSGGDAAAATDYQNGVVAAFQTAYRTGTTAPAAVPANPATATDTGLSQYQAYVAANAANPLVSYATATASGSLGKQAIILYQKYLAMNTLSSVEAWDDYRRAAQPKLNASGTADGYPVASQSTSTRPDHLPTRLLYPLGEYTTNPTNVAATGNPSQFTKIFWDVVD